MKMTYKELGVNKRDCITEIISNAIKRYLPDEAMFLIVGCERVGTFTYCAELVVTLSDTTIDGALVSVTIPPDMRKQIEVTPYYRNYETYTAIEREIDVEYVYIYIKEYLCIDTDMGSQDILISADKIPFRIKGESSVKADYYSLYVDRWGIIRLDNRQELREDTVYIDPVLERGENTSLCQGYIRKSIFCKGSIDYAKHDRIVIHVLTHNAQSTKYCLHRMDSLFLPVKYMDHIRELTNTRKWG